MALLVDDDSGTYDHADRFGRCGVKQVDGWINRHWSSVFLHPTGCFSWMVDFTNQDIQPLVVSSGINVDSLHNKMGKFLFVVAIAYCLIADFGLSARKWYSQEVVFSDWRGIPPVDYSTNVPVSTWYSGHSSKYLRAENLQQFLAEPDTVTLGIDYYALTPVSGKFASGFHFQWESDSLKRGGVLVAKSIHGKIIVQGR